MPKEEKYQQAENAKTQALTKPSIKRYAHTGRHFFYGHKTQNQSKSNVKENKKRWCTTETCVHCFFIWCVVSTFRRALYGRKKILFILHFVAGGDGGDGGGGGGTALDLTQFFLLQNVYNITIVFYRFEIYGYII